MAGHAVLSPSGFKALMLCPAKPAMERGILDRSSGYADEGTAAHFLGSECLAKGKAPTDYLRQEIAIDKEVGAYWYSGEPDGDPRYKVADLVDGVRIYVDMVRQRMEAYSLAGAKVELYVEVAVPIGRITGEEGAQGTSDVVLLIIWPDKPADIEVIDLKFGQGVEVSAGETLLRGTPNGGIEGYHEPNPQMALYALGAMELHGLLYEFGNVTMIVSQPRITGTPSEFTMSAADLVEWGEQVADPAAQRARTILCLNNPASVERECRPHPDACRFCKAKPSCPALSRSVQDAMGAEFTDLTTADKPEQEAIVKDLTHGLAENPLGAKMDAVDLVEMWCKAIRGETERQLLAGLPVPGYKLVQGRKGARDWKDAEAAEKMLKSFRLKNAEMYDFTVISPTTAEKKFGAQPKRWTKLCELVKQADGKPSVAPIADKRPALEIKPVADEFVAITEPQGAEDLV